MKYKSLVFLHRDGESLQAQPHQPQQPGPTSAISISGMDLYIHCSPWHRAEADPTMVMVC